MPKIYRGMKQDQGKPALGPTPMTLGARVPEDIYADASGLVYPGIGGMSVSPSLLTLPYFRVSKRLRALRPDATGSNELCVWSMGVGNFADGFLTAQLQLRLDPDNEKHGFVEPAVSMSLDEYQNALISTRDLWTIDEK